VDEDERVTRQTRDEERRTKDDGWFAHRQLSVFPRRPLSLPASTRRPIVNKETVLTKLTGCIGDIRKRFSVKNLAIFGSIARDEAADSSDVDVLVVFDRKGSFDLFMDLKFYLEKLLGTQVDLVTDKALRPQVRRAIEHELIHVA
jgi:predicted nucleotidyltransferase